MVSYTFVTHALLGYCKWLIFIGIKSALLLNGSSAVNLAVIINCSAKAFYDVQGRPAISYTIDRIKSVEKNVQLPQFKCSGSCGSDLLTVRIVRFAISRSRMWAVGRVGSEFESSILTELEFFTVAIFLTFLVRQKMPCLDTNLHSV